MIARLDHRMMLAGSVLAVALCVLVVALVFALRPVPTTGAREASPASHATGAEGKGVSRSVNFDPAIDRHTEVVARYHEDSLR